MLLEREQQAATLQERLKAADGGAGSLILVGGEAGAGKSSLVADFIAPLGGLAVVGACDPLSTPAPLSPLRDFIDVGDKPNLDLFATVLERFGRSPRSKVMVIEDLHWADQATLDFVRYLGRRVSDCKLVVICTYRDDEIGVDHPLRILLGQLARLRTTVRLGVPMLSLAAVQQLVAAEPDPGQLDPAELHELTGGNAFFVTEIIAAGGRQPQSLHDAVLTRLAGLRPEVRQVIETVSISPRSLELARVLALGNAPTDIDSAVAATVLIADGDHLRFRHELARTAVENAIPPARRHQLHRATLRVLLDESRPDSARLAHHAVAASAPELIARYAPAAARDARARGSSREAAALLRAALTHPEHYQPIEAGRLRMELGIDLIGLDQPADGLEQLEAARDIFATAGAVLDQVEALRHASRAHNALGQPGRAMRAGLAAVELAEQNGPSEQLVLALNGVAGGAMLARRASQGEVYANRAATLARQMDLTNALRSVEHVQACLALVAGDADTGLALLSQSVTALDDSAVASRVVALANLGSGAGEVRRYDIAIDALVEAEALGVANDVDASVDYTRAWLARIAFEQGRWDDAVAYATIVDTTATNRRGFALLTARGVLGRVRVRRGDPGGADLLEETLTGFHGHDLQYRWSAVAGMAEHHWLQGDDDSMVQVLSGPYEEALETESQWARGELGYWLWKAGQLHAPPERAAAPFAAQIRAEADDAAQRWEQIGSPYEVALARSEGSTEAAIEALAVLHALGAKPLADRVRSELRALGVDRIPRGPSEATKAHALGLTGRQAEVLDLIVAGLSNLEIAARLYVSKKTVEHHVSAVYAKLGVENRAQAIVAAR